MYSSHCTPEDRREKTKIISTTKTCTVTFFIMRYEHNATPSFGWRIAMCYHVCVDVPNQWAYDQGSQDGQLY